MQLGKISRFGLMELSRQRLRPALAESAYIPCPRCHGIGHIRGTESSALHILRILQEEAMKENTAQVVAQMPVDVATFLLNEKRTDVLTIETRFKVNVLLVPNRHLETPNYTIERLQPRRPEPGRAAAAVVRHRGSSPEELDVAEQMKEEATAPRQEAMVKGITPAQPAPIPVERPRRRTAAAVAAADTGGLAHQGTGLVPPEARRWRRRLHRSSDSRAKARDQRAKAAINAMRAVAGVRNGAKARSARWASRRTSRSAPGPRSPPEGRTESPRRPAPAERHAMHSRHRAAQPRRRRRPAPRRRSATSRRDGNRGEPQAAARTTRTA